MPRAQFSLQVCVKPNTPLWRWVDVGQHLRGVPHSNRATVLDLYEQMEQESLTAIEGTRRQLAVLLK